MSFKKCLLALLAASTFAAAQQDQAMPYDLIRPVWPLTWDSMAFKNFVPDPYHKNVLPAKKTPLSFAPNEFIPDTIDQAYLDNLNTHISPIRVNQAGYLNDEDDPEHQFYYVGAATSFEVVSADGKSLTPAVTGTLTPLNQMVSTKWNITAGTNAATNRQGRYSVTATGPSGQLQKGNIPLGLPTDTRLRIKIGDDYSSTFIISDRVYSMVRSAALKFYGINRSGYGDSWFHPASHTKDGAGPVVVGPKDERNHYDASLAGTLQGGYYDCGDHLKEAATQMYAFMVAAVTAATNPEADEDNYAFNHNETANTDGIPDMLREAKHGADFVLRSFVRAKGVIDDMALSVGNFGSDHGWWGRPENQDGLPVDGSASATDRGGPSSRTIRLGEIGANYGGEAAAGLAIMSKDYAIYDKAFADSCLMVAEKMYDFAKGLATGKSSYDGGKPYKNNTTPLALESPAYHGNGEYIDDMALAAVALWYATGKKEYADDAIRSRTLGTTIKQDFEKSGPAFFEGGWFVTNDGAFLKNVKNTGWANSYAYATYALYKLILQDKEKALSTYGLTETEWLNTIEDCVAAMIVNIGDLQYYGAGSPANFEMPTVPNIWKPSTAAYDGVWYTMLTDQTWIYNRYRAGDIFEVLAYADVASDIEKKNIALPMMGTPNWKAKEAKQFAINQLNYLLGVNPWDVSFIMGVGDKNDAHPHHRAANPEGKNMPGAGYKYKVPVGALYGAVPPALMAEMGDERLSWENYEMSEVCIDAAATLVGSVSLASKKIDKTRAPSVVVEVRHVSMDSAIVSVKLDARGTVSLNYGIDDGTGAMNQTAVPDSNVSGVHHEIILRNLQPGTTYNFYAIALNAYNPDNYTVKYMTDSTQTPYSFTTLNTVENADIQNITVCNLSGDSAEIMWYTPNGEYESKLYWDVAPHDDPSEYAFNTGTGNADISGIPTKFHYVKIGGLKEKTTYYYMVESNGMYQNVNEEGLPLKFTTPVTQYDFSVKAYQYFWQDMSMLNINVYNNESRAFDSLTIRLYMRGTDEITTDIGMGTDICQAYDEAGFNKPCSDETKAQLERALRDIQPQKIEDTYDAATGTWQWFFPLELGSTVIKSSSRLRFDVRFDHRSPWPPYKDLMNEAPNKKVYCLASDNKWYAPSDEFAGAKSLDANPGDWSWMPHSKANGDYADYPGLPCVNKDEGDIDFDVAPVNPYMAVYRKDEFVWGYSPSRGEMETKKANYEIDVTYDPPFDVSNGSFVEIDQSGSTVFVTGHAHITEGGYITKIWANGKQLPLSYIVLDNESYLSDEKGNTVAHYNMTTDLWDLNIPVKMAIGSNKVDITVFAGPDPECDACTENGGCAFNNRSYYVQFTKGNATASALTIKDENGAAIASPAEPGATSFNIYLTDKDKINYKNTITVKVVNTRKGDSLSMEMVPKGDGSFVSKYTISAVPIEKGKRTGNQISFFPGDVIRVTYIDPEDEEDESTQSFFAESNYPTPQKVYARSSTCANKADFLTVKFSNALGEDVRMDSIHVFIQGMLDTVNVPVTDTSKSDEIRVSLTGIEIPETATPKGSAVIYLYSNGGTSAEKIAITDGILPQLLSVTILENPAEPVRSAEDTVMIAFSEPVNMTSLTTWPLVVPNGGVINVVSATTNNDGKSWQYVVTGNTDGTYIPVGGKATINSAVMIGDNASNMLDPNSTCTDVTIVETPKPVPVTLAEMRDFEGDGYADELYLKFKKGLREKDMLDSFVVEWGDPGITKSFYPADWRHSTVDTTYEEIQAVLDADGNPVKDAEGNVQTTTQLVTKTISIITIAVNPEKGFPLGATSGPYDGKGHVTPRLGPEGGFFDKYYLVQDMCAPIIVRANKSTGKSTGSGTEFLTITASEPVKDAATGGYHIERLRGSDKEFLIENKMMGTSKQLTLIYDPESDGAVRIGDKVRFAAAVHASIKDAAGNIPTEQNPWVKVNGNEKTRFTVKVDQPITTVNPMAYGNFPPQPGEDVRVTIVNNDNTESLLNNPEVNLGPDYIHGGIVFHVDISIPNALYLDKSGQPAFRYNIKVDMNLYDNMGQFINKKTIEINSDQLGKNLSEDGMISLNVEWLSVDGEAPLSSTGRKIATGAYIGKFDFKASEELLVDPSFVDTENKLSLKKQGDKLKTSDNTTKTFGFKRAKRK